MGLFKPIWMTENSKKRDKAVATVQKLSDASQLEDAAINAPLGAVAQAACERITDQPSLAEVAIHAGWSQVARHAASRIDDPALLVKVALGAGRMVESGAIAVERIDDQGALAQIARTAPNAYTRIAAMEKLEDLDIVAEIAYRDPDHNVSIKALDRIADPRVIEDIARTVQDHYVRIAALEKIDSPELIRDIEASWSKEQKSATSYANMLSGAVDQIVAEKRKVSQRVAEGRCPKCGVRLTEPRGSVPNGAAAYCSNCGARIL